MDGFLSTRDGSAAVNLGNVVSFEKRQNILRDTVIGGPRWELVTNLGLVMDSSDDDEISAAEWLRDILNEATEYREEENA